ncbi:MAG: response regulator [Gemmatimonadetes bacterium]|nr:response regulator [Gemmatimonadota bacterium]
MVRSLRLKVIVTVAALVAGVLAANASVLAVTSHRRLRRDIEQRGLAYAALAAGPIAQAYQTYYASGYGKFRELVMRLTALNPDVVEVAIYDTQGRLLAQSSEFADAVFDPGKRRTVVTRDGRLLRALQGLTPTQWPDADPDGGRAFVVVVPHVEEWGRHRYSVVFSVSYASLRRATLAVAWQIGGLAAASLTLGLLIAVALAAQSLRPVEALTGSARALAGGDLRSRIRLETGDEFELLAHAFNQMADRLAATIADLEKTNVALNQMNLELRQLDRMKSDLLANVSHELRTPLTAIRGYAEAIDDGFLGPVEAGHREALVVVKRNVERLMGMIEQLLSYSRAEVGAQELDLRGFRIEAVAEQVVEALKVAHGRTLNLHFDRGTGLPSVYGDPVRISQVLENLLTNAIKFTPSDGRIELRLRRLEGEVEVAVSDTGIGIPPAELGRIFDRFYQVDSSSTRRYGGMGLGLALVRQILQAHRRRIDVVSTPGVGTTFRFTLPEAEEAGAEPELEQGRRIVLVDDDPTFCQTVSSYLTRQGFVVETALTGEQGVKVIAGSHPDLVLLDRLLPDCDGFDLLARLKRDERTCAIPVLVASIRQERALGLRLGASAYLVKPLELEALRAEIEQTLSASPRSGGTE